MCEPFCCHFQFNGIKHSIELSEEFCNEVFFKCIFDKIKQIIQILDNKSVSFDSHVFEVLSKKSKKSYLIKGLEFKLKSKDLIIISEKPVNSDANGCDSPQRHGSVAGNPLTSDKPIDPRLQRPQTSTQNTSHRSQPTPTPNLSTGTINSDIDERQRHGSVVDSRLTSDKPIHSRLQRPQTSTQNTSNRLQPTRTPNSSTGTINSDIDERQRRGSVADKRPLNPQRAHTSTPSVDPFHAIPETVRSEEMRQSFGSDSLLMTEAKIYSENNCDLIVDYEWNNVIHKRMAEKGYKTNDRNHWKTCYEYLVEEYIKTLKTSEPLTSVIKSFPMFCILNTIYFNEKNRKYQEIMNCRKHFLESRDCVGLRNVVKKPEPLRTLYETVQYQRRSTAPDRRQATASLQAHLERRVSDIKHFNLLVQIVGGMAVDYERADRYQMLATASKLMAENGIQWDANRCDTHLKEFIRFYSQNEKILKSKNKVIEYINKFLNAFTKDVTIVKNLLYIYRNNNQIIDSLKSLHLYEDYFPKSQPTVTPIYKSPMRGKRGKGRTFERPLIQSFSARNGKAKPRLPITSYRARRRGGRFRGTGVSRTGQSGAGVKTYPKEYASQ